MAGSLIFALAAVAWCAELHARVNGSLDSVRSEPSETLKGLSMTQSYADVEEGKSGRIEDQPLWFLTWPFQESSSQGQVSLDELASRLEDSIAGGPFWLHPPRFLRQVLELKSALVAYELDRLESPDGKADKGEEVLNVLFDAYAHMRNPLPASVNTEPFGTQDTLEKVIKASGMFWSFAADAWPKLFTRGVQRWLPCKPQGVSAKYFWGMFQRIKHMQNLRKVLRHLRDAEESVTGIYFDPSTVNMLSSRLVKLLKEYRTLTPSQT